MPSKEITVAPTRYAFIKANWHAEIVSKSLDGFLQLIPAQQVDVFEIPGAFELPLFARDLANSGKYAAVAAAALVATLFNAASLSATNISQIQNNFDRPPDDARIMVRWWWFGPAVTKPERPTLLQTISRSRRDLDFCRFIRTRT